MSRPLEKTVDKILEALTGVDADGDQEGPGFNNVSGKQQGQGGRKRKRKTKSAENLRRVKKSKKP